MEQTREYMLDIIQKEIMWIKKYLMCFDCMAKEWRVYPWKTKWYWWICIQCKLEWEDIWLNWTTETYKWDCTIWDVLDWVNKNIEKSFIEEKPVIYDWLDDYRQDILYKWHEARKPIQDQSDECIRYIYSLLPPEVRK